MTDTENVAAPGASLDEIQQSWHDLTLRVAKLEAEAAALLAENKGLRSLIERVIDHRQKTHTELVLILANLVGKLPMNDVGLIVTKLVEHNTNVSQFLCGLGKGTVDANLSQPEILKALDHCKRALAAAAKPTVDELIQLGAPLDAGMLQSLLARPDLFFSPAVVRATRCFIKGYVPRDRVVREFGQAALAFFNDLTTDPKLNPRPKPDEIVLGFKDGFESLLEQQDVLSAEKRQELLELYHRVQRSKAPSEQARAQRSAFQRLSFLIDLLHFYEHPDTEAPDLVFAQRLPGLLEQLVLPNPRDSLDERLIAAAENLLAFVVNPDHRLMIINNVGKAGGTGRTLKFVLRLRMSKPSDTELDSVISEFIRSLIPPQQVPAAKSLTPILRLLQPDMQRLVLRFTLGSDRIRKDEAETLVKAIAAELGIQPVSDQPGEGKAESPEEQRQKAWAKIKDLIARRNDPAAVAAAIRDRLHAKYDADEIRHSWIILIEADSMALIKIICQIPYLAGGKADSIARPVLETYISRLTHEKYATTYHKVVNTLKTMFSVRPDNPTLITFMALVRWTNPEAAHKLSLDVGMPVAA